MLGIGPMIEDDITAARNGDRVAFGRLVREHAAVVCAIATAIVGSASVGEEVGQEVFVHAWQEIHVLRDPARFGSWLKQSARNRAHDVLRKRARSRELPDQKGIEQIADANAETGDHIDEVKQEAALWSAFASLDEEDREVLALFYRQDSSVHLVAEALGLREPTVRKRLSRARSRLREGTMLRLGAVLARTAPGAAFAASIVAGLAPAPAQAASVRASARAQAVTDEGPVARWRRSRLVGAAVCSLGIAAVVLGWLSTREGDPRPSQTRAGRASLVQKTAMRDMGSLRSTIAGEEIEAGQHVSVSVRLGTWNPSDGSSVSWTSPFRPGAFWPTLDEAPFPETEEAAALVDHVQTAKWGVPLDDVFVAQLETLQTDALPDDPWTALLTLEALRLHAYEVWEGAKVDFAARHLLPDPKVVGWHVYNEALVQVDEEKPSLSLSEVLDLARQAKDAWPEHPIDDYASLYVLVALAEVNAETHDPAVLSTEAMAVLKSSDDPLVLEAAATQLANAGEATSLTSEDLDLLSDLYLAPEAMLTRQSLSDLALEAALYLDDPARAAVWMPRYHETLEESCGFLVGSVKLREAGKLVDSPFDSLCKNLRNERDQRSSWLAARGVIAPVTWQAALVATVRRCSMVGQTLEGTLTGEGQFDGAWSWHSWSEEGTLAACIAASPHEGPTPPPLTEVSLEVLPPLP